MHNLFCILPSVEGASKRLLLVQKHSEEQGQILVFNHSQHFFGHMLHFRVCS